MKVVGSFHTAITVRDMEESLAFYEGIMGMKTTVDTVLSGPGMDELIGAKDVEMRLIWLDTGNGSEIELLHYINPKGKKLEYHDADWGVAHLCLEVEDAMEAYEHFKKHNVKILVTPDEPMYGGPEELDGYLSFHVLDPNGFNLEIKQKGLIKKG